MELSQKDFQLIASLRKNNRQKLTKLSRELRMPVKKIQEKLQKYNDKIISKHTILLNFDKLGFMTRTNIIIAVKSEDKNKIQDFLVKHPEVNNLYQVNNGYDFLIELITRNDEQLDIFMQNLETEFDIKRKDFQYILKDIKREMFIANKLLIPDKI
ncbi:Lrp/AsnC family transcriptional regulator [Candidatus Woesearchaeota archaeon]|nr:Lrp/AsnC family transcriptional regulator [Candidatus Woesearchaeota archaeon]